ncbi:RNA polymerase sigma-70 factor [Olivibacter ginsenosidimutans]|uniref:RNA polymerase sigma-70 factor n=1 Tax=Olivibacter ginsenosidimutans TaxID=1176537 RepID=A0ABP9BYJ1_9SPHI
MDTFDGNKIIDNEADRTFYDLYRNYFDPVCQFITRYVYVDDVARDLAQDVFIKIWYQRDQLLEIRYLKTYIFTIAKNHTLNHLRVMSRSRDLLKQLVVHHGEHRSVVEDDLQFEEYQTMVYRVLESIPERSRIIFSLCREEGKTYAEVASLMGVSKSAIKNHMVNTLKMLKNKLESNFGVSFSLLFFYFFK